MVQHNNTTTQQHNRTNILLYLSLVCTLAFFPSCETSDLQPKPTALQKSHKNDIVVIDGTLHFKDYKVFKQTFDQISHMKDDELDNWDKSHNFVSFRSLYWNASDEFGELKTDKDFTKWQDKYNDIIYMNGDVVTPKIPLHFYQLFSNRKGEFVIGDNYNKVYEDKLITIIGGDKAKLDKALLLNKTSENYGIIFTKFSESQVITTRDSEPGCFTDGTGAQRFIEKDGDRRAYIKLTTVLFPIGGIGDGHNTLVTLRVYGYKKKLFGWGLYKTLLAADDVEFRVSDHEGHYNSIYNYSNTQNYESKNLYEYWNFGATVIPDNTTLTPFFVWLKGRGVTRGTGDDHWAVICCNYNYSQCPSSSGADPFP